MVRKREDRSRLANHNNATSYKGEIWKPNLALFFAFFVIMESICCMIQLMIRGAALVVAGLVRALTY